MILRTPGRRSRVPHQGAASTQASDLHLDAALGAVGRTLAWLSRFRRPKVRYEQRVDVHEAFVQLSYALITWDAVLRFCQALLADQHQDHRIS